jgi:hypothetical protein
MLLLAFASVGCQQEEKPASDIVPNQTTINPDPNEITINLVPGKKHIVLLVNTAAIGTADIDTTDMDVNPVKAKPFCSFPDQHGISDSLYTTHVYPGDTVVWLGVSTSAPLDDKIDIDKVIHRGGPEVLDIISEENGIVEGIVLDDKSFWGENERYAIRFRVNDQPRPYVLDPILRVHAP